jgi:putative tryptophan/tyrosine transport system substrate-binding protein
MKRREFITLLGGAVTWPLAARAEQQPNRMRRVGVLMTTVNDEEGQARIGAFVQRLQQRGWSDGSNVQIETRWVDNAESIRRNAQEAVALAPDVIVATASPVVSALQQASRMVPIVFVSVIDPVGGGFVESLARPGGNATGFMLGDRAILRGGAGAV